MLDHQGQFYVSEIIRIELTSHFGIEKIERLVAKKCYEDLQLLLISTYCWKDLLIDFVTRLPQSMDWNGTSHNSNGIACSTN